MNKGCFRAGQKARLVVRGTTSERLDVAPNVFFRLAKGKNLAAQADELCDEVEERLWQRTLSSAEERVLMWMLCWSRLRVEKIPFSFICREVALMICDLMLKDALPPPVYNVVVQHPTDLCFAEKFGDDLVVGELSERLASRAYEVEFEDSRNRNTASVGLRPGYVEKKIGGKGHKAKRLIVIKADKDIKLRRAMHDNE
jgi:hypothetical protein